MSSVKNIEAPEPGSLDSATALRRLNTQRVLDAAWGREAVTASELISLTGLTRATVLNQAKELVESGWLVEAKDTRAAGAYSKGRPALRYELNLAHRFIVGIDAGQHRISLTLSDVRGTQKSHCEAKVDPLATGEHRVRVTEKLLTDVLEEFKIRKLAAIVIGVPAPVDADGMSPDDDNGFWVNMNPDWKAVLGEYTYLLRVENDANLAAIAEMEDGTVGSFASLMVGERIGAGVVVDNHLLRGDKGLAGEMRFLSHVAGVGNAHGLGYLAREQAKTALSQGAKSSLAELAADALRAEDVFQAAVGHDQLAQEILESLGDRLARISAVISGFLGLERVVLSGAMAEILEPVVVIAQRELAQEPELTCVQLTASTLGAEVAMRGAVDLAVQLVRSAAPF
ncbi:ROK family transcriptional regulator [Arthrobacter sp. NIO-1057]|uniref:ROK family transcriptional regulator n=1 Tax=Arthrobacter sp. NIO-1057 TaxID=993071 RepID=UPI00159F043F|nr:ROK family protein [Arthrobacter sp. NIO-1057]